ncbi:MAG: PilZ domain-containing protein [Burkholderiales bacterium]|nr:PilZ domain-containing protein [Burkholderiales bacterium]
MATTMDSWENADRREASRARLQLRLALIYPQREGRPSQPIYHAKTHDICLSGLSMVVDDNVYQEGEVTILLALPPVHSWASQKIITATAVMTYAIHSSKLGAFKIGMTFLEFKEDGKRLLQEALLQDLGKATDGGMRRRGTRSVTGRTRDHRPRGW